MPTFILHRLSHLPPVLVKVARDPPMNPLAEMRKRPHPPGDFGPREENTPSSWRYVSRERLTQRLKIECLERLGAGIIVSTLFSIERLFEEVGLISC